MCLIFNEPTYLKQIFIISRGHLLHFRRVWCKTSNCICTKGGHFPITGRINVSLDRNLSVKPQKPTGDPIHSLCALHRRTELELGVWRASSTHLTQIHAIDQPQRPDRNWCRTEVVLPKKRSRKNYQCSTNRKHCRRTVVGTKDSGFKSLSTTALFTP